MMETKNEYNFTEIGKIPVEWDIARMESIGSTYGGLSGKTKDDFEEGNQNFVSYRQIFSNPLLKNQNFETVYVSEKEKQNEVEYGDVLFTTSSETPDEVAMSSVFLIEGPEKHFLNSFSFGYRFNNLQVIDPRYYGYYFRGDYFRKLTFKLAQGSTRYNISKNKLIEEVIHIPPLKEQQKIAEILSTVDEQIEQTNQLIEKITELKKGLMQQLLTRGIGHTKFKKTELGEIPVAWEVKTLQHILNKIVGGGTPSRKNSNFYIGSIPWVTVKDMKGDFYQGTAQESINEEAVNKSSTNLISAGNVIIATRMALGRAFINTRDIAINQDLKALYLNKEVIYNPYFLYWYLSNAKMIESLGSGTTVKGIRVEQLTKIKIVIPPMEEQRKIAEILSSVDEEIEGYQEEKVKYEELKKGLMQQLLTGKKRVKV